MAAIIEGALRLHHGAQERVASGIGGLSCDPPDCAYGQFAVRLLVVIRSAKTECQVGMREIYTDARRRVHPLPLIEDGRKVRGWVRPYDRRDHFVLSLQPLVQHAHWAQAEPAWNESPEVPLLREEQVADVLDGRPYAAGGPRGQHRLFVASEERTQLGLVVRHGC